MSESFEEYVLRYDALCAQIDEQKAAMQKVAAVELEMRNAIAVAVGKATPGGLTEGVNKFPIGDRVLKVTRTVGRKLDKELIKETFEEYQKLNDQRVDFASLIRVKYELDTTSFRKLTEAGEKIVSRMITAKDGAYAVELD